MSEPEWRDAIVGDRMRVDQEFAERVQGSGFSNQQWSLIMTAVQLELEGSGEDATLVADTSRIPDIAPELDRITEQMGAAQPGGGNTGGSNLVDTLKSSLGLGGGSADEEMVREAEQLASAYAAALESHLRENGRWDRVVELG
jgi:hypothetical protein